MDFIALIQSKRFWMFFSGVIVVLGHMVGLALDPQRVLAVCLLLAGLMHADTVRPIQRKAFRPLKIFPSGPAAVLLMMGLVAIAGCNCIGCNRPGPTPAPDPETIVQQVTRMQLKMVADGYHQSFATVADEIRSGSIKSNDAMRKRLVELTRDMRLAAEVPVLDEMNAHLPQDESGDWPDPTAVSNYLQSLADGYQRTAKRLE